MQLNEVFQQFSAIKVAVVGDVMLDSYLWGNVERISPEAPVPVVQVEKKELRVGGAANVALNTVSLGAETTMFSVVGNDDDGTALIQLLKENHIQTDCIIRSKERITTNKTRVISRNQHMLRLDAEITSDLNAADEAALTQAFRNYIALQKPQVVIFEDYNKGVLTATVIENFIQICKQHNIITTVDPKRKNFFAYKDVDIFKPNLKEVKEGLNLLFDAVDEPLLTEIHKQLSDKLHHKHSFITLSEKGVFYTVDNTGKMIPSHVRNIADVSGAGDTVIAVASLVYAATQNMQLAASMANIAGGMVCEEVGTAAINKTKFENECAALLK